MQINTLISALISAKTMHFSYSNNQSGSVISNLSIYKMAMFDVSVVKLTSMGGEKNYYR